MMRPLSWGCAVGAMLSMSSAQALAGAGRDGVEAKGLCVRRAVASARRGSRARGGSRVVGDTFKRTGSSRARRLTSALMGAPEGRLELTWTNKHQRLLAHEDGSYEWVGPGDYRVAETRLLHDVDTVGDVGRVRAPFGY